MIEEEARRRVALLQRRGGLPAHVAEHVAGPGRLDDRHVGAVDEPVERRRRLGVAAVREHLAVDVEPVAVRSRSSVVEPHRLVAVPGDLAAAPRRDVPGFEPRQHHRLPIDAPAHLEQRLQTFLNSFRPDEREEPRLVDEDAVQHERRQSQRVIAVEVGEKYDVDVAWLDAEATHVRQQRGAAVEQHPAVDRYGAVITLRREGRPRTEECKFQATVTAVFR